VCFFKYFEARASSSAAMQAVDRLEHAINASAIEPSTCKREDKASCQAQSYDKETSTNRE